MTLQHSLLSATYLTYTEEKKKITLKRIPEYFPGTILNYFNLKKKKCQNFTHLPEGFWLVYQTPEYTKYRSKFLKNQNYVSLNHRNCNIKYRSRISKNCILQMECLKIIADSELFLNKTISMQWKLLYLKFNFSTQERNLENISSAEHT